LGKSPSVSRFTKGRGEGIIAAVGKETGPSVSRFTQRRGENVVETRPPSQISGKGGRRVRWWCGQQGVTVKGRLLVHASRNEIWKLYTQCCFAIHFKLLRRVCNEGSVAYRGGHCGERGIGGVPVR
jgi:hypothetical protein